MLLNGDSTGVADHLTDAVETLARAGTDVAIIAANTPHIAFDAVQSRSRVPMVSIVEAVADHVRAAGMRRVGLLGTRFTMTGQFYSDVFAKRGLSLVVPASADLEYVHDKYLGEFLHKPSSTCDSPDLRCGFTSMAHSVCGRVPLRREPTSRKVSSSPIHGRPTRTNG
jgi:aspartate/glutamate racemase